MDPLSVAIADRIATVTINRPQQGNAITLVMWQRLAELCAQLDENRDVRVVVVRGSGEDAFSTGGDISEFAQRRSDPWHAKIYNGKVELALSRLLQLAKPTIALVNGYCLGGGCLVAAHCDLRIAADNAQFGLPVAKLSNLLGYRELERFVHLIGLGATMDMLLTARLLDAPEAKAVGLCSRIYPLDQIDAQVYALAAEMTGLAPLAQKWHKQMIHTVLRNPELVDLSPEEEALPDACFETEDYAEGIRAFLEKRTPHFRGK